MPGSMSIAVGAALFLRGIDSKLNDIEHHHASGCLFALGCKEKEIFGTCGEMRLCDCGGCNDSMHLGESKTWGIANDELISTGLLVRELCAIVVPPHQVVAGLPPSSEPVLAAYVTDEPLFEGLSCVENTIDADGYWLAQWDGADKCVYLESDGGFTLKSQKGQCTKDWHRISVPTLSYEMV